VTKNGIKELADRLLELDRPVPRYTSYPPANHFVAIEPRVFINALKNAGNPLSIYVHIPFCKRKCTYCGCFSMVPPGQNPVGQYIHDLASDMENISRELQGHHEVAQIQFGGGTPNFLTAGQLSKCMNHLKENFRILEDAEIGVELDPTFLEQSQVDTLKKTGFNRVSLGVQDLDQEVQRLIGRGQSREKTVNAFNMCQNAGFDSIHIDLVYGLPGQSVESLQLTLQEVIDMGPDRLSLFGFAYLPGLRPNQAKIPCDKVPGSRTRAELYLTATDQLTRAGYVRIGMDHFAKRDDELAQALEQGRLHRNFQGYTSRLAPDLLGFGVSAISDIAGAYFQNTKSLEEYSSRTGSGVPAVLRGFVLSEEDKIRRQVIESIMCNKRISFKEIEKCCLSSDSFNKHFEESLEKLSSLAGQGLIELNRDSIEVKLWAWPLVRLVAAAFDEYLEPGAVYSRVI